MAGERSTPFPLYNLNTDPVELEFHEVEAAFAARNYEHAVESSSRTLAKIQEMLVLPVLDQRSLAFAMQAKFQHAISDAQKMIAYGPTLATGYLRLGELYRMQGKQLSAIDIYDIGLQSVSKDHPDYARMVEEKQLAIKRSEARLDFIAGLPVEIVDDIIALLPNKSKSIFLTVSSTWRNKILKSANTWKTLTSGDGSDSDWTTSVIPHIARHVEDLTIHTTDRRVFLRYLLSMRSGLFHKMKSLRLDESATMHINAPVVVMSITNAFWNVCNSLSKLVLHLSPNSVGLPLLELLSACSNLTTLEYSTASQLSEVIGELTLLNPHDHLADMQLKASSITANDLRKLLPHCKQLRRLLLSGCYDIKIMDAIDILCPNLETFGYNPDVDEVQKLDHACVRRLSPGLYRFYTKNGGRPESALAFLPLIRRNMHSLKTLYVNISARNSPFDITEMYEDLRLPNMERLTFWADGSGTVQPLILRAISTCTLLTHVSAVELTNIPELIDVLVRLPRLECFKLSHVESAVGEEHLIRLFTSYSSSWRSDRILKTISFRYCPDIITDNVFDALTGMDTLEDVTFEGLPNISVHGMAEFFKKMGNSISRVELVEMNAVTNISLAAIGSNVKSLKRIQLESLGNLSDRGIMDLVDQAFKLESLSVKNCSYVSLKAIAHAKKKVKLVI